MKKPAKWKSTASTSDFVFDTPVEVLYDALSKCNAELFDLLEYKSPSAEQKKRIRELTYWLGTWEYTLQDVAEEGLKTVKTCAIENRVLGIYTGKKESRSGKQKR